VTSVYDCEGYRLPTEAEWEYAARAGTLTAFHDGLDSDASHLLCEVPFHLENIAWYCGNSGLITHPIGQKSANAWELYDMSGNVGEWVWDRYAAYSGMEIDPEGPSSGDQRAFRGGSEWVYAHYSRSASRGAVGPIARDFELGFRLARSLP